MSGLFKGKSTSPAVAKPVVGTTGPVGNNIQTPGQKQIANDLIAIARTQIGVREHGFNKGKEVEQYQDVIGGVGQEAWCMAFMQWVALQFCTTVGVKVPLYPSEHCQTVFDHTPEKYRRKSPAPGYLFIQKSYTSQAGHTGICTSESKLLKFGTVEGNTDASGGSEGDGVYETSRLTTGTATKSVRGYIDLPLMIQDAMYALTGPATPVEKPVDNSAHVPNVKGDWNANLDSIIMGMVTPELLALPIARMKKFMPGWDTMNTEKRKRFFADLLFAMCRYESNYDRTCMYWEDTMGLDHATGLPVVSEGLLQLSYQDAKWYDLPFFDYVKDAALFKKDWLNRGSKKSWKSMYPERTTLDAENGVRAAMVIFIKLLTNPKLKNEEFADTIGRYWACMKRMKSGSYRPSFLGICAILKGKGYKT